MTVRVVAPYFVAGVVITGNRVTRTAPIVRYMLGWTLTRVQEYGRRKGWQVEVLTPNPPVSPAYQGKGPHG